MSTFAKFNQLKRDYKSGKSPMSNTFTAEIFENSLDFALLFSHDVAEEIEQKQENFDQPLPRTEKQNVFKSLEEFVHQQAPKKIVDESLSKLDVFTENHNECVVLNHEIKDPRVIFLYDHRDDLANLNENESDILLKNMIKAMNIPGESFHLACVVSRDNDNWKNILLHNKPQIVVAIGAIITKKLLGKLSRLSKVHGHEFKKQITSNDEFLYATSVFPIFHPEFLILNPNMKRTTWEDMKKIMLHWQ